MLYDAARPLLSYVYKLGFYRAAHEGPSVPYLPPMTETAHTRKRVDEFVARIIQGEFLEVMPEYDSPDAIARENSEPPRVGLEAMMANEKLTYFDIPVSRGEECRLALFVAGVPFEDERLNRADWNERTKQSPYGALPILTVDGLGELAQSNAILRYVGVEHGLHPSAHWEAARHDEAMNAVEDLRAQLGPINRMKDPEEKKRAREELAKGYLLDWAGYIEKQIAGPFFGGEKLQVADLKLFVMLTPLVKGVIDHIPADVFKPFAKLTALFEAVKAHPKVVAWYAR